MSESFGKVPYPVNKNEHNAFVGQYDKASILGRFASIDGTTMGEIIGTALNLVNLEVATLENLEYTEEQARGIASLMGDIHMQLDAGQIEEARKIAKELAGLIDSI